MTYKNSVLEKIPFANVEKQKPGLYYVYYFNLNTRTQHILGVGNTKREAWQSAYYCIISNGIENIM